MQPARRKFVFNTASLAYQSRLVELAPTFMRLVPPALLMATGSQRVAAAAPATDISVFQGKNGWLFPAWESLSDVDVAGIQDSVGLFEQAQQLLQGVGTKLFFVVIPTKASVEQQHLPDSHPLSKAVKERYTLIQAIFQRHGLASVDVLTAMTDLQRRGQSAYYRTDYHWTSAASEATADATARLIAKDTPIPKSASASQPLGEWVNERHFGDLAANYLSPRARAKLGREVFRVRLEAAASGNLLDDELPTVHVMGNSFVQPYWGFSQRLSQQLGTGASLTWQVGNTGHWAIALKHAATQLKGQPKPLAIVWQLNEAQIHMGPNTPGLFDKDTLMPPHVWLEQLKMSLAN